MPKESKIARRSQEMQTLIADLKKQIETDFNSVIKITDIEAERIIADLVRKHELIKTFK